MILIGAALGLSIAGSALTILSEAPIPQYLALLLWMTSCGILIRVCVRPSGAQGLPSITRDPCFWSIVLLAATTRLIGLETFPFPSIGEEIRDTGLEAQRLLTAPTLNLFGWGRYQAHGLLPALSAAPFEYLLGPSVLAIRSPAAILAIAEVGILYHLIRATSGRVPAIYSALFLLSLPLHLYLSRTQLVVLWSSALTTLALWIAARTEHQGERERLLLVGLFSGVALGFHASIRVVILALLIWCLWQRAYRRDLSMARAAAHYTVGCLIGLGPRLFSLSLDSLLHSKRLFGVSPYSALGQSLTGWDFFWSQLERIGDSFRVFYDRPLMLLFPSREPIILPATLPLLLLGLIVLWRARSAVGRLSALVILLTPIVNSGLTDVVNASHRLAPLLPVTAIYLGAGGAALLQLARKIPVRLISYAVTAFIAFALLAPMAYQTARFFSNGYASKGLFRQSHADVYQDYLARYAAESLRERNPLTVCIVLHPSLAGQLQLLHGREFFRYLVPDTSITFLPSTYVDERTMEIRPGCIPDRPSDTPPLKLVWCEQFEIWRCPNDGKPLTVVLYDLSAPP